MKKQNYLKIGAFGTFHLNRVKGVNQNWLAETWNAIESLGHIDWFIGIYSGFDLVTWAVNKGIITTQEFRNLYTMLLDPSVNAADIDWKFISPVLHREMLKGTL